jgi:hypothetical protein
VGQCQLKCSQKQGRVGWRLWQGCWSTVAVAREWEERASPITELNQRSRRGIKGTSPHFWTSFKIIEVKQLIPNEIAMRMSGGALDYRNLRLGIAISCTFRAKGWKSSFGVNSRDLKCFALKYWTLSIVETSKDRSVSDSHVKWAFWDVIVPKKNRDIGEQYHDPRAGVLVENSCIRVCMFV